MEALVELEVARYWKRPDRLSASTLASRTSMYVRQIISNRKANERGVWELWWAELYKSM